MKVFEEYPSERLFSLDCLRGLDMLLLTVLTPLICAADDAWKLPDWVMMHCRHDWGVLSLHDVIMPCFIFMCGAAVPFALGRRMDHGRPTAGFWRHVATRFALLYVLGSIVQCNLLSFDPMQIHVFYNTLQVIGVAYVMTALVMLIPSAAVRIAIPVASVLAMGLIVHLCGGGDYSQTGNFAYRFDRIFWGLFLPVRQHSLQENGCYCYLLPQLGCSALAMCGCECARVLRGTATPLRKSAALFALSAVLFLAAALSLVWVPVIKHIYSLSFTLYTCAWSVLALAVLYVMTDVWRMRRGLGLVILFGQNALAAYMLCALFKGGFAKAASRLTYGLPHLLDKPAGEFLTSAVATVLFVLTLVGWSVWKRYRKLPN